MSEECLLDKYTEIKECLYKDERYSVRDNGAVFRHVREGKRKRKDDNVWTFGKPNEKTGYMEMSGQRVHRIVAYAFLGEPPTPQHVVDHIDTNRRNNRPENLRWLTRLENALNNPITRARIENICGSIEAFLANPSILRGHENVDMNFSWMRAVSPEEAQASLKRLTNWAKERPVPQGGSIGEWIFMPLEKERWRADEKQERASHEILHKENLMEKPNDSLTKSLTPNAMQKYWRTPTEFPLCPSIHGDKPLDSYMKNLKKGSVVTRNQYSVHFIDDFAICNDRLLMIRTHADEGIKPYSIIRVTYEKGKYVHEGTTYFDERAAEKALTLAQGLEWKGGDVFDDLC